MNHSTLLIKRPYGLHGNTSVLHYILKKQKTKSCGKISRYSWYFLF